MSLKLVFVLISVIILNEILRIDKCEGRYLPTRSQENRLSKLEELLQEILKSEDKTNSQLRDNYRTFNERYTTQDDSPVDEGYPSELYDNRDVQSRIPHRFYIPQSIMKT